MGLMQHNSFPEACLFVTHHTECSSMTIQHWTNFLGHDVMFAAFVAPVNHL